MTFDKIPEITGGAIKLTRTMQEREHTLKELRKMEPQQYVSKILKGTENLSLETLTKLEQAMGERLIAC